MKYDLEERCGKFGEQVVIFCRGQKKDPTLLPLITQLIRSGTSIGANYMEANQGCSRKDFVNNDFHGWYGIDFIMKSIKSLESKENDLHFFVFSDDIDWCKNNLNFLKNHTLVDHTHSGYKFGNYIQLMTECKHFIVPNSTFAFWASFLSKNKNKKIIRPKIWFKYGNLECDFLFETLNYEKIDCMFH